MSNYPTSELFSTVLEHAREKYDSNFVDTRNHTLEKVREYFTQMHKKFKEDSKFPQNAYSRIFKCHWVPNDLETFFLQEMGFVLGDKHTYENGDLDRTTTTTTTIQIPENKEGTPLTPAQKLYEEHVSEINKILENALKNATALLQKYLPDALPFVDSILNSLREGTFSSEITRHNPDILTCSITMPLRTLPKREICYSSSYELKDIGKCLENYIWNFLSKNGFHNENGVAVSKCKIDVYDYAFELVMIVQLPEPK